MEKKKERKSLDKGEKRSAKKTLAYPINLFEVSLLDTRTFDILLIMKKGIDHIGVGVGAIILNKEGKALLAKRGPKAQNEKGKWIYPGGGLKFGEAFEECVRREMKEEFDIEVEPIEQLEIVNHIIPEDKQHWVAVAYVCKLIKGKPKIQEPEKEEEIGWFTLEETEKLSLTSIARYRLKQLKEKYPNGLPNLYT